MIALSLPRSTYGRLLPTGRKKESTRFLTSISQILVIFEPDSNLDAKNPQIRFRTIVPSYQIENRICT